MRERGIIFSAAMVRAILDGTKRQTRRLVTARSWDPNALAFHTFIDHGGRVGLQAYFLSGEDLFGVRCPYGTVGDKLWVRETWSVPPGSDDPREVIYRADVPANEEGLERKLSRGAKERWTSSRYMPRWASRLALELTSVRVERLQSISEEDAQAEGVAGDGPVGNMRVWTEMGRYRYQFAGLWDAINGKKSPWSDNPYIWVIGFQHAERPDEKVAANV